MAGAKIRVVILGGGNWAAMAHIPALRGHPDAEVVGLWKRDAASARKMADHFSIPFASSDAAALIRECRPDAAIVSTVAALHHAQAKIALEAGLHVLIEKPMTFTAAEAEELQEIADRKGLHFLISHPWHYTRHAVEARKLLQSGAWRDLDDQPAVHELRHRPLRGRAIRADLRPEPDPPELRQAIRGAGANLVQRPGDRRRRPDLQPDLAWSGPPRLRHGRRAD
jgi:hypothetical protein